MAVKWPVKDVSLCKFEDRSMHTLMASCQGFTLYDLKRLMFLQIVYTALVGFLMLAAFLEWVLWIGAFMYCLWKVFRKSEHWTVNVLAVIIAVGFLLLR